MTVTVDIINNGAFNLLSGMERLNLIKVSMPEQKTAASGDKISKQFSGALKLSNAKYEAFQNTLQESRDEWNRDIY